MNGIYLQENKKSDILLTLKEYYSQQKYEETVSNA
jgi:hypothetical protein